MSAVPAPPWGRRRWFRANMDQSRPKVRFIRRQYFRRFLRPINRMRLTPSVVGRTAFVGLIFGLTASVGIQLIGVALVWLVMRLVGRPINLAIAVVLTGVTNPLTIAPIYTIYFVTGCTVLSCDNSVTQLEPLIQAITELSLHDLFSSSWNLLGKPLAVTVLGSLPFALAGSLAGYRFGKYVGQRLHLRRVRRAALLSHQARPAPPSGSHEAA